MGVIVSLRTVHPTTALATGRLIMHELTSLLPPPLPLISGQARQNSEGQAEGPRIPSGWSLPQVVLTYDRLFCSVALIMPNAYAVRYHCTGCMCQLRVPLYLPPSHQKSLTSEALDINFT